MKCTLPALQAVMFNQQDIENKIKLSAWWHKAGLTIDCHYCNTSGVMLTHHLQSVCNNIDTIFKQPETGFYGALFALLNQLEIDKAAIKDELKIVALLHDIGKIADDKSQVIPHPLTGKPAHKRHGVVSLVAAIEILANDLEDLPPQRNHIYRTIELHDMSYGLYREHQASSATPPFERWNYINNKIDRRPAVGLLYLLIFKLADIHGHANIADVLWFYNSVKENYFNPLKINLPVPAETDIR